MFRRLDGAKWRNYAVLTRERPVITVGERTPNNSRHVGARSASSPPSRSVQSIAGDDQRHGIRRVGRVRADAVCLEHLLRVAVVGRHEADAAPALDGRDDLAEAAVHGLDRLHDGRDHSRVADHVGVGEVHDREAVVARLHALDEAARDLGRRHLRLLVIRADVPRGRDQHTSLPGPRLFPAAVQEVRHVGVLLRLGHVKLADPGFGERLGQRVVDYLLAEHDRTVEVVVVPRHRRQVEAGVQQASARAAWRGRGGS